MTSRKRIAEIQIDSNSNSNSNDVNIPSYAPMKLPRYIGEMSHCVNRPSKWSYEEDMKLLQLVKHIKPNNKDTWFLLSKHFSDRSVDACRQHHPACVKMQEQGVYSGMDMNWYNIATRGIQSSGKSNSSNSIKTNRKAVSNVPITAGTSNNNIDIKMENSLNISSNTANKTNTTTARNRIRPTCTSASITNPTLNSNTNSSTSTNTNSSTKPATNSKLITSSTSKPNTNPNTTTNPTTHPNPTNPTYTDYDLISLLKGYLVHGMRFHEIHSTYYGNTGGLKPNNNNSNTTRPNTNPKQSQSQSQSQLQYIWSNIVLPTIQSHYINVFVTDIDTNRPNTPNTPNTQPNIQKSCPMYGVSDIPFIVACIKLKGLGSM